MNKEMISYIANAYSSEFSFGRLHLSTVQMLLYTFGNLYLR